MLGRGAGGRSERPSWADTGYQRGRTFRGYRNGYHPARELTVGLGPVAVRVPRVAQVPREVAPQGYHSGVVQRYQRASQTTQRLVCPPLFGRAGHGRLEPVFREPGGRDHGALGQHGGAAEGALGRRVRGVAPTSPRGNTAMPTSGPMVFYLSAGAEQEKTALLCVLGAREDGEKELLAMARATGRAPRVGPT